MFFLFFAVFTLFASNSVPNLIICFIIDNYKQILCANGTRKCSQAYSMYTKTDASFMGGQVVRA